MAIQKFNPAQYGITNEVSVSNLCQMISAYEKLVAKIKGTVPSTAKQESDMREWILNDSVLVGEAKELFTDIRDRVLTTCFESPVYTVHFHEFLEALRKDVKTIRDWHVSKCAKDTKVTLPLETSQMMADARKLSDYVQKHYSMVPGFFDDDTTDEEREQYDSIKTKVAEKSGKVSVELTGFRDTSDSDSNGSDGRGRGIEYRIYRYNVNGQDIPAGTHLRDVLMEHVSDSSHVFSVSWVLDELKRTNQELSAKPGSEYWIDFPNGTQMAAWVPEDTVVSNSESEDSTV